MVSLLGGRALRAAAACCLALLFAFVRSAGSSDLAGCSAPGVCDVVGLSDSECSLLQTKTTRARVAVSRAAGEDADAVAVDAIRAAAAADNRSGTAAKRRKRRPKRREPPVELLARQRGWHAKAKAAHAWQSSYLLVQAAAVLLFGALLGSRLLSPVLGAAATKGDVEQPAPVAEIAEGGRHSVELKIGGMTCSACSSTVERSLRSEKGVLAASVNLVMETATVVFDANVTTAAAICESVEDVGFDGSILSQGPASEKQDEGKATLHLQVQGKFAERLGEAARGVDGVLALQPLENGVVRITYRPQVVGARDLLARLRGELPEAEVQCAPPQESSQIGDLQRSAGRLWFNFAGSALPAAAVFAITIILPSFAIELGTISCGSLHIHVATLVVLLLATPVQFVFGAEFHVQARKAMARKSPNMDVLVSLATSISFGYAVLVLISKACKVLGHHVDAAMVGAAAHHHEDGVLLGLSCHALHFFGMAPILMAVVLCGKFMETKAKIQTMESLVRLMECKSHTAQLVSDDKEEVIHAELVQLGDTLRFFEGSHLAVDGVLTSEASVWVSEAILTGESTPTEKKKGSTLLGGTTVSSGSGFMVATAVGSKTALGEIMTLISNAQATKTLSQQLANTVAGYFVATVMGASVLVFCIWLWIVETHRVALPKEFDAGSTFDSVLFAAKFGVAVLMVACPCAMGLATPTAIMVSTGVAAQMGCLVKSALALEEGCNVDTVVLDKTGTITEGAPRVGSAAMNVAAVERLPAAPGRSEDSQLPPAVHLGLGGGVPRLATVEAQDLERSFWWYVGAAERGSDHPIARCLVEAAQAAAGCETFAAPDSFRYKVGRGVSAVFGGVDVRVGSFAFLEDTLRELKQTLGAEARLPLLEQWATTRRAATDTVVVVHAVVERQVLLLGAVAVRDAVREDAPATIEYFRQRGIDVWMCTGDTRSTALAIAKELGLPEDRVHAEALPKQKADKVAALKETSKGSVLFVGDGVNDAPALASADVGVAIGAGARLAVDAADVVLVRSELATLAGYLKLSQETVSTIRRNYAWAFVFNFIGLPAAAGIFYPRIVLAPLVAGLAMGMSSTVVVTSSLMLRFFVQPKLT